MKKDHSSGGWHSWLVGIICMLILTVVPACRDEEELPADIQETVDVNTWIYEVMQIVYFWEEELPAEPDFTREPLLFFEDLLFERDRFSRIFPDYEAFIDQLNGITLEAGYEFQLVQPVADSDEVWAVILYTKDGTPAADAGLKRGDIITHINGTAMNLSNYQNLVSQLSSTHTIIYEVYDQLASEYVAQPEIQLTTLVVSENPIYRHQVLTSGNGKKTGYLVYNFFTPGDDDTPDYNEDLRHVFTQFKNEGIEELILDLRYNPGGFEDPAVLLASLIAPGVTENDLLAQKIFNDEYQVFLEQDPDNEGLLRNYFQVEAANVGAQISRVYVLVSSRTASASELVINGLLPYMDVILIGTQTTGKNVGSFPIRDNVNEGSTYGMAPIVFKTFNSLGQSDYDEGFIPDAANQIRDLQLPLQPLGDPSEPLLAHALLLIDGGGRVGDVTERTPVYKTLGSSLQNKFMDGALIAIPEGR